MCHNSELQYCTTSPFPNFWLVTSCNAQEFLRGEGITLERAGCLIKQAQVTRLADSQGALRHGGFFPLSPHVSLSLALRLASRSGELLIDICVEVGALQNRPCHLRFQATHCQA